MKALSTLRNMTGILALLFLAASATSCEKEVINEPSGNGSTPSTTPLALATPGKYSAEVTLTEAGSSVKLLVTSDNQDAINAFSAKATMQPVTGDAEPGEATNTFAEAADVLDEANAIHVTVLESELAAGFESFNINITDAGTDASLGNDMVGPYYFYSFDAPHSFKLTPAAGECASAWLYQRSGGTAWSAVTWAGGDGGNYVCNLPWTANSSVTTLDYKLKTHGTNISVSWY